MLAREFHGLLVPGRLEQAEGQLLVLQLFAVLERHVEKSSPGAADLNVIAMSNRSAGYGPGKLVSLISFSSAPEHVAWQLVEQQHGCQCVVGTLQKRLGGQRLLLLPQMLETTGALPIQRRIMLPPALFTDLIEPEIEQSSRPIGGHRIMAVRKHVHTGRKDQASGRFRSPWRPSIRSPYRRPSARPSAG